MTLRTLVISLLLWGISVPALANADTDLVCLESAKQGGRQFAASRAKLPEILSDRIGKGEIAEKPCKRETLVTSLAGIETALAAPECNPPNAARQSFCDAASALKELLDQGIGELDAGSEAGSDVEGGE